MNPHFNQLLHDTTWNDHLFNEVLCWFAFAYIGLIIWIWWLFKKNKKGVKL